MRTNLSSLERTDHGMVLHFPIRDDIVDQLETFFRGNEPASTLAGLL